MNEALHKIKMLFSEKKNLYILLIIGILILISANFITPDKDKHKSAENIHNCDFSDDEKRLEEILSKVEGAGKTNVMITYETGTEKVTLQNSKLNKRDLGEENHPGTIQYTEERETVMTGSGSSQTPFISKEIRPRVRGVIVVAEGGGNNKTKYELTNAVAAVLDVAYYRIQVLQKSN